MVENNKRIIIAAGGTGGHIFPALAIARYLISQGWHVKWLGTNNHLEADILPKYGINIDFIRISGLKDKPFKNQLSALLNIFFSIYQAFNIIKSWKPSVVLSMGGYVSAPGGLAAWIYGIPVIIHEQNSVAGLTNRILAKIAYKILQAFPGAFSYAKVVGNPIRHDILTLPSPEQRLLKRSGPIRLLIVGGSQGAYILNKIMPAVSKRLLNAFTILHQVGKGSLIEVNQAYANNGSNNYQVTEFIHNMSVAYYWADVIICRAGALTVSEISVVGLAALFVPFVHKDKHQYRNARALEQIGAAKIIEHSKFTVDYVSEILISLDRPTLLSMAKLAKKLAIPKSTELVVQEIISTVHI